MNLKEVKAKINAIKAICAQLEQTIRGCREGVLIQAVSILCEECVNDIEEAGL